MQEIPPASNVSFQAPAQTVVPPPAGIKKEFSISEAIKFGFNFFKKNIATFLKVAAVMFLINIILNVIDTILTKVLGQNNPVLIIWLLIYYVISIITMIGFTKIFIDLHDGKPLNLSTFYSQYSLVPKYFAIAVLYLLVIMLGYILLIIPGIIWAIKFQFNGFLIIDKRVGIIESFKKSSAITQGVKMNLFLFGISLALLNIVGILALGIGLFVTIPTSMMAIVYVYRKLLSQTPGI